MKRTTYFKIEYSAIYILFYYSLQIEYPIRDQMYNISEIIISYWVYMFLQKWPFLLMRTTVGENSIATNKIRNNYGASQSLIFSIFKALAIAKLKE